MTWLWGALVGAALTALSVLLWRFFAPGARRLEEAGRKAIERDPVILSVEADLNLIYSGLPDWIGSSYYLESAPTGEPPQTRGDWQRWIAGQGGWDFGLSTVQLVLVARSDATVLLRAPVLRVDGPIEVDPGGVVVTRPVGGASVYPLGFDVEVDSHPEVAVLREVEDEHHLPKVWSLTKGEAMTVLLRARATQPGLWQWTAVVPLEVDGRKVQLPVSNEGRPFAVVGTQTGATELLWGGSRWLERSRPHGSHDGHA